MKRADKLVVGISGASGMPIAAAVLRFLKERGNVETHLIVSAAAERAILHECDLTLDELRSLADVVHDNHDLAAPVASGTFGAIGMLIVPCSMKTLSGIAHGYSDNLLLRAADVCLKERRRLALAVRETPLSSIHLRNMLALSDIGATIVPPVLTYYHKPDSVMDMTLHMAGKLLDLFGFDTPGFRRWQGMP